MNSTVSRYLFLLLLFILSCSSKINGLTIDIVHRQSKLSPFYNKNAATKPEFASSLSPSNDDPSLDSDTTPNGSGDYIMRIFVGTPPLETFALVDTGSDLVWFQCAPCSQCYAQNLPLFDPTLSHSYEPVSCYTSACHDLPRYGCGSQNECTYDYPYADGSSYTRGILSTEIISMSRSSVNTFNGLHLNSYPGFVFGCGHQNDGGSFNSQGTGVVGLNRGPLSLISQLGVEKFSYCLTPARLNSYGKMVFGDEVKTNKSHVSTPLLRRPGEVLSQFYYVNLEGATVNGTRVENKLSNASHGSVLLDSGTELCYFNFEFQSSLEAAVKKAITSTSVESTNDKAFTLCYLETPEIEVVFHFMNANVTLKPENLFKEDGDRFCFAFLPTEVDAQNIYGNIAQTNFEVVYDLANSLISFAPANCGNL